MLVVSPLSSKKDEKEMEMESFSLGDGFFAEFTSDNLIDSIDFGDLFVGVDIEERDVLPDLEMDQDNIVAEFSSEESEINTIEKAEDNLEKDEEEGEEHDEVSGSGSSLNQGGELLSKKAEPVGVNTSPKKEEKGRKSSKKDHQCKRKVKVDWTPELHRRFVQAVEQLGVDKAVPSRILELMGIDYLTRHNIASHLQKYRSHRKHLLAREAEAASWSQKRQMYNVGGCKREMMTSSNSPWLAVPPTIGFLPMHHQFRPLHVWGHPTVVDQSLVHLWPKHIVPSPTAPPPLPSPHHPPPPTDPSFWHAHHQVQNSFTPGAPYFPPQPLATRRLPTPLVPEIPTHAMYKVDPGIGVPASPTAPRPPLDFHASKESIDAAIGDVLSNPWQSLPLGLKSPSLDSVMVELTRQGIQKIPPFCS